MNIKHKRITDNRFDKPVEIDIVVGEYGGGGICLSATSGDGPYATFSVKLKDVQLPADVVFIKDYSENAGTVPLLIKNGVIGANPVVVHDAGLTDISAFRLTPAFIRDYCQHVPSLRNFTQSTAAQQRGVVIKSAGFFIGSAPSVEAAIPLIEALHATGRAPDELAPGVTFEADYYERLKYRSVSKGKSLTIEVGGAVVAAACTDGITGSFSKQVWIDDIAREIESVDFDAKDIVLGMSLEDIHGIEDCDESSDAIGTACVQHNGPYSVYIQEAICNFFGVDAIGEITQEGLDYARSRHIPTSVRTETAEIAVRMTLRVNDGASIEEFLRDCNVEVLSKTADITVQECSVVLDDPLNALMP